MSDPNPYFPPDLLIEILLKLPVKSLIRFLIISKSWYSLITDTSFISTHLNQKIKNTQSTLLVRHYNNSHNKEHYSLFQDIKNTPFSLNFSTELNFPLNCQLGYFRIVGTCNGVVCLCDDLFGELKSLVLWNPSIQKITTLPLPLINPQSPHMFVLGFGGTTTTTTNNNVDDVEYKLVRLVYHKKNDDGFARYNIPPEVEIFSINTMVWRRVIGVEVKHFLVEFMWSQVFLNGAVHWIAYDVDSANGGVRSLVMSFSVGDEVFKAIMLPEGLVSEIATNLSVMVFEGLLCVVKYQREIDGGSCEVWVMKNYGVLESWSRLYRINLVEDMEKVVGFRSNGEVLFSTKGNEMVCYDPNSGDKKDLGIRGSSRSFYVQNYVESLVLLKGNGVVSDEFLEGMGSLSMQ
ncbi:F-box protein At3g07870-like [Lycium ferocissimum]|uniref:F-box protein At3g07870-like n=1 Tax=Lycium ferocissimum TaxID=112874 RepID=UPI002814A9BE|nr:F-box protein At3g07870-like [Lycium ferocissimum]XP_059301381.1 F-box protein At3g07870-like [Lycium ferocissimum]